MTLSLYGCGSWYHYSKPGFAEVEFNQDLGSCKLMARAGRQTTVYGGYGIYSATTTPPDPDPGIVTDCMRSDGYTVRKCSRKGDLSTCE